MVEENGIELFITEAESLILETLAQGDVPYSQRAQALLAIDAGSTIEQAAQVAQLKVTQVRYWIGRFRNDRLEVFPDSLIEETEASALAAQKAVSPEKKKKKKAKVKKAKKKPGGAKKAEKKAKKVKAKGKKKAESAKAAKAKKKKGAKKSTKKSTKKKK
jgi:hypothetical protein